jgi:DNA double-strand break repair helicase HerA and related ATPase
VLGQLGNRVQHALRAFTPKDQRAVKSAADTLRPNPRVDIGRAITELAVGEALVSVLDEKGTPTVTERAWIVPPASQIGPITDVQRATIQNATVSLYGHYNEAVDRDSAYEILKARTGTRIEGAGREGGAGQGGGAGGAGQGGGAGGAGRAGEAGDAAGAGWAGDALTKILLGSRGPRGGKREGLLEAAAKSAARSVGSGLGRAIIRGTLGSILGSGRSRR